MTLTFEPVTFALMETDLPIKGLSEFDGAQRAQFSQSQLKGGKTPR